MCFLRRVTVQPDERALLMRNGLFERLLGPGRHWLFSPRGGLQVVMVPFDPPAFLHPLAASVFASDPRVTAASFVRVDLGPRQVGLRHDDGVLVERLAPGTRRLYWRSTVDVRVRVVELADGFDVPSAVPSRDDNDTHGVRQSTGLFRSNSASGGNG